MFYRERAPDIAATFPSHAVIDPAEIDPVLKDLGPLLNSPRGGVGPPCTGAPRGGSGHNLISHSVAPAPGQLGRMPSVPADAGAFFDETDLANLDGVLDFDNIGGHNGGQMDGVLRQSGNFGMPQGYIMDVDRANTTGDMDHAGGLNTSSEDLDFYGSDHEHNDGSGNKKGKKGHGRRHSGESFEIGGMEQIDTSDLDPKDPKYRRRIQNRMASARFRAKAKERQQELDRLKSQVTQLRREKGDLEAQCRNLNVLIATAAEQHRTSTMAWIVDHFWLRRKVHFKTLANSVRWMVRGQYRKGMTDAVLRAKLAAEGIVMEESSHAHDDGDESDVSMDDAGFDKNNPDEQSRRMERRVLGGRNQGNPGQTLGEIMAGDDESGKPTLSPNTSWKLWATLQKLGSFGRSKPVNPDTGEPIDRPYTR